MASLVVRLDANEKDEKDRGHPLKGLRSRAKSSPLQEKQLFFDNVWIK